MQCIVTGFDAFDKADVNPSQQAVERLDNSLTIENAQLNIVLPITRIVLPTCCDNAWASIQQHVAAIPEPEDFFLLLSGLAEKREKISLERFALNVRNYRIADNRGHQHDDDHIEDKGPDALRNTLPLRQILQHLSDSGLACEISDHAGSFVCNETYYRSLRKWAGTNRCKGVLFVHFPGPDNYVRTVSQDESAASIEPTAEYARALTEIIRFVATDTQVAQAERI